MKPLTGAFLKNRKKCCGNGCRNCPYDPRHIKGTTKLKKDEK
jgi:2,5-diketo-D-gluconate reductase A